MQRRPISLEPQVNTQPVEKSYYTFVAGLNTDASPLNFPDNFSSDEENFVLNLDGSRQRRKGLTLETGGTVIENTNSLLGTFIYPVGGGTLPTPTVANITTFLGVATYGTGVTFTYTTSQGEVTFYFLKRSSDGAIILGFDAFAAYSLLFTGISLDGVVYQLEDGTKTFSYDRLTSGSGFAWEVEWPEELGTWPSLAATPSFGAYGAIAGDDGTEQTSFGIVRCHHWRNVDGNPDLNFLVMQNGQWLQFFQDDEVISTDGDNSLIAEYDLSLYAAPDATDVLIQTNPINTDYGRGHLFVVGKYIEPLRFEYDQVEGAMSASVLSLKERDFNGLDDKKNDTFRPAEGDANEETHRYNLLNQGWTQTNIDAVKAADGFYPSKAMIQWKGVQTAYDADPAATENLDYKQFSADKLLTELFQDSPAPMGHFIINSFDTSVVTVTSTSGYPISIADWTDTFDREVAGTYTITLTLEDDHTISDGDTVTIEGTESRQGRYGPKGTAIYQLWSYDGTYDVTIDTYTVTAATSANPAVLTLGTHPFVTGDRVRLENFAGGTWDTENGNTYAVTAYDATTITLGAFDSSTLGTYTASSGHVLDNRRFDIDVVWPYGVWSEKYWDQFYLDHYGVANVTVFDVDSLAGSYTYTAGVRPTAVAFYAGRVWYAGIRDKRNSHRIHFSQVVEKDSQYEKCYQVADPTSQDISDLVDTDGGVINIPEMDGVHELLQYNGRLLVFAENGIWEIMGGNRSYFTTTNYTVRQISNVGAVNAESVVVAEGTPFYWSDGAINAIQTDPQEGFLFVQDVSTGKIENLLLALKKNAKKQVQAAYDKGSKKVYWLYDVDAAEQWYYTNWLTMDLRLNGAFSKFRNYSEDADDPEHIKSIYDIESYENTANVERNIKFVCMQDDYKYITFAELNNADFEDFGVDAAGYLETGNDSFGDATRRRYGRYLFTYMKRTETGYDSLNASSLPLTPSAMHVRYVWNWADTSNTGKWSNQQSIYKEQIYKYRRPWTPTTATDIMGESVVVAKSKIRGSGRVLRLRFDTVAGYDAHLYGWHLRQDITKEA